LDVEAESDQTRREENLNKIQESIEDCFMQSGSVWTGSKNEGADKLQLIVKETIAIALKSAKAAQYIQ